MNENNYTLQELSEQTGIGARTIRSYIHEHNLLRPAHGRGPNAYYDQDHLDRLQAIKMLRGMKNISLSAIGRLLMQFDVGEVSLEDLEQMVKQQGLDWYLVSDAVDDAAPASFKESAATTSTRFPRIEPSSALDFIREYKRRQQEPDPQEENSAPKDIEPFPIASLARPRLSKPYPSTGSTHEESRPWTGLNPPEKLLRILKKEVSTAQPRSRRREEWVQFEITPDIRLQVRGDFDIRQQAIFAQIADAMREILLGGTHDEDE